MFALYLDLSADGRNWLRPALMDRQTGYEQVNDAVNDYSTGRQWFEGMYSAPGCQRLASNPESAARAPQPVGWGIKLGGVVLSIHAVIAPCR